MKSVLFLDNKYTKWYYAIINNAQTRQPIKGYGEVHHIVPRSMKGSDEPDNLVKLTAKEHFVTHHLLTKMTTGKANHKMWTAFHFMVYTKNNKASYNKIIITARLYDQLKREIQKVKIKKPKDITGNRIGKILVLEYIMHDDVHSWKCQCDCGKKIIISNKHLMYANRDPITSGCGCGKGQSLKKWKTARRLRKDNALIEYAKLLACCAEIPKIIDDFSIKELDMYRYKCSKHIKDIVYDIYSEWKSGETILKFKITLKELLLNSESTCPMMGSKEYKYFVILFKSDHIFHNEVIQYKPEWINLILKSALHDVPESNNVPQSAIEHWIDNHTYKFLNVDGSYSIKHYKPTPFSNPKNPDEIYEQYLAETITNFQRRNDSNNSEFINWVQSLYTLPQLQTKENLSLYLQYIDKYKQAPISRSKLKRWLYRVATTEDKAIINKSIDNINL